MTNDIENTSIDSLAFIADKIQSMPEEIKNVKVHLLLPIEKFKQEEIFGKLPENLILADLPKWLAKNSPPFDDRELLKFISELPLDLKSHIKEIIHSSYTTVREFEIICWRAKNATLFETGKNLGLTRERVRQIEIKWFEKLLLKRSELKNIFYLLRAVADKKFVLNLDDVKKIIDPFDANIIWFIAPKIDSFSFDKEINALIFFDCKNFNVKDILKNIPESMDEKTFYETIEKLAREKNLPDDLLKSKLLKFYNHSGKFFYRGTMAVTFKFAYVLKERFPEGYKIADKNFYSRFTYYIREIFGDDTPLYTQHNVDATIAKISVLCARGKYIHPDFVKIPPEIINCVKDFIDNSDHTAIFYKEIFQSLKNIFVGTQITNHYFLQGVIKLYKLPYTLRKDYLTKSDEMNMSKEFNNFVREKGLVTVKEIKKHFISFKKFNIVFLMKRCPEVIRIAEEKYMHSSLLKLQRGDKERIEKFLKEKCLSPLNSRFVFELFSKEFPNFLKRNKIHDHEKLFGVLGCLFRDKFKFSRPYISIKNVTEVNNKKVLLGILADKDEIGIENLVAICEENRIYYVSQARLVMNIAPDFIRVNKKVLRRPKALGVTDEIISAVVKNINAAIERNGGWQSLKIFEDYDSLPQLKIAWNSFLLESVLSLAEDSIYKVKANWTKANDFSSAIFVAKEFAEDDYKSFVIKILIAKNKKEPFRSEEEIFEWLKAKGLCYKKLPNFLAKGKAFDFLGG